MGRRLPRLEIINPSYNIPDRMTTIAIDAETRRRLERLKEEWHCSSMNEVVRRLVNEARPLPKSMFGIDPTLPRLTRKMRDEIWS